MPPTITEPSSDEAAGPTDQPRAWWSIDAPGAWGAVALGCLSMTPSLLPRGGVTQGIVAGISAAIGYGLGLLLAATWRAIADRDPRPNTLGAWRWFGVVAFITVLGVIVLGEHWQTRLRTLMGMPPDPSWRTLLLLSVAVVVFAVILSVSRTLRTASRRLTRLLQRRIGPRAARTLGWVVVTLVTYLLLTGVLLDASIAAADRAFSLRDTSTQEGVEPTQNVLRSGGPGSLVPWDSLGRQGRNFTTRGPSAADIAALWDGFAAEPIRAYAGMATADDVEERARLAVDDLARAGGFDRDHLLVATTTGTGWLDPGTMASFEYLTRGDSAIVTMQYSYLPSWLSYLVDQRRAREAGRELFDAVYERWSLMPPTQRPQLYVFGESLGSFGAEAAFSGEFDLRNRTDGALFVGAPNFNPLHREFTEGRDAGSRQIEPVVRDGRTVRFANEVSAGIEPATRAWDGTRVLYLQHPSDPIVWWSPELLTRRPDWLSEPRGRDVLDQMIWLPFITFWQVTADLPFAVDLPPGHGHRYTTESVDAWAAILQPPGWTETQADVLRREISG
ncbi:MAG: hypothetical protein EA388_06450 [Nitriliruptor sp.]|nr:MAG: hypothetical protein EA388_06450 [Nitriliruptor sp.]